MPHNVVMASRSRGPTSAARTTAGPPPVTATFVPPHPTRLAELTHDWEVFVNGDGRASESGVSWKGWPGTLVRAGDPHPEHFSRGIVIAAKNA